MEIMCQSRKVLYILYLGLSTLNNEKINKNVFVFFYGSVERILKITTI